MTRSRPFLCAALSHDTAGLALNVGGGEPYTLFALAEALIRANGGGGFEQREFPADRKRIDIGDFVTDDRRFRALTGWAPRIGLDDGLARSSTITAAIWRAMYDPRS